MPIATASHSAEDKEENDKNSSPWKKRKWTGAQHGTSAALK